MLEDDVGSSAWGAEIGRSIACERIVEANGAGTSVPKYIASLDRFHIRKSRMLTI